jgi:hypothetical protein
MFRMYHPARKLALAATAAIALAGLVTTTALAAGDTDDFVTPSGSFSASATGVTFQGTINGFPIKVTCNSSLSGTVPATGLVLTLSSPPSFTSCHDSLGGSDTVTESGTWTLTFVDAANDETAAEPNSGDTLSLAVPANGATFTSSFFPSCHVIAGSSTVTATYDDVSKAVFTNQKVNTTGSGCTTSAQTTFNGTYTTNHNLTDAS